MLVVELLEQRARQKRRVAAEHHDRARLILQQVFRLQDGMARAELLRLRDELSLVADGLADHFAAKARHDMRVPLPAARMTVTKSDILSFSHLLFI